MVEVALVGCGRWGRNIARALARARGGRLAACCDPRPVLGRASFLGREVAYTPNFDEIVNDPSIDAVAIATPPALHHPQARMALLAGKHVFVEKPFSLSSAEAEELVRCGASEGRIVMAGHIVRYHPAVAVLRDLVAAGEIGKVTRIVAERVGPPRPSPPIGVWWTLAPHDLSLLLSLTRALPIGMAGIAERGALPVVPPHRVVARLHFPGGIEGIVHVSWLSPVKRRVTTIEGEGGTIRFDDGAGRLLLRKGKRSWREIPFSPEEPLQREIQHFVDAVRHETVPLSDGREALAVTRLLEGVAGVLAGRGAAAAIAKGKGNGWDLWDLPLPERATGGPA